MNKIYKIIWSKVKLCYVVVSELAKRSGKGSGRTVTEVGKEAKSGSCLRSGAVFTAGQLRGCSIYFGRSGAVLALTLSLWTAHPAYALPVLDAKDTAVSIAKPDTVTMNIASTAANNVIKWVDFSIGDGVKLGNARETVAFDTKNYLNYVTGSARSDILGTLTGGGNIYIVNPNGILIGDSATVNVGNLYLSTKQLDVAALTSYDAGITQLSSVVAAVGDVVNLGHLNATSITVEGNNITFKNVADAALKADALEGSKINVTADGEIRVGFAVSETPATAVNDTQYKNVTAPDLTGWSFNGKTPVKYMLVRNAFELQNMQNNLDGNYMLAGDIILPTVGEGESNFTPIGSGGSSVSFTGRFDGLNYRIQNLTVESGAFDVGLFGYNYGGVIENVELVDGSVTGTRSGADVGGVVGLNQGTIRNVVHTGSVTGTESNARVGGVVGWNQGTVQRACNTGAVKSTGGGTGFTGGVVGLNQSGTVSEAFNTGAVEGTYDVGGIVGQMGTGSLQNAYNAATGKIKGANYIGGIVGQMIDGSVENVYNTGAVEGTGQMIGGIVGYHYGGTLTNAYSKSGAAVGTSTVSDTVGYNGDNTETNVAAKTEAELKQAATFNQGDAEHPGFGFTKNADNSYTGFSADGVWRIYEDKTMPLLTAFLTRKDNITSTTEYNGSANAGATYTTATYSGAVAQDGFNYIRDVAIVTPKDLAVTFGSKTYDGTTDMAATNAAALTGVVGTDDVLPDATNLTAAYADKNVGTGKTVNYTGIALSGTKAKNYNLAADGTGTGDITAKTLTVSFADIEKTYDGTTDATAGAGTLTGVEAVDSGKVNVTANAAYDEKNAGNRTVNYTGVVLSGAEANNYSIAATATGAGVINRKALELVADNVTIRAGEATPTKFTGNVTGFVAGEGIGSSDTLAFALSDPSVTTVGSYGITGTLNGSASGNYGLNYTFSNAAANATAFVIAAKPEPKPASAEDTKIDDLIPAARGTAAGEILVTELDNAAAQATPTMSETGIEFAIAQAQLPVDADRQISIENNGMKQPSSMTPQEVAEQVHAQQGNGGELNAATDMVQQTDNAVVTEESRDNKLS